MTSLLSKRELKLQKIIAHWTRRLRRFQTARLMTALLFFLSLIPVSLKDPAQMEFLYPLPFLSVFFILVIWTRQIHRHVQNLQRFLQFTLRQKNRVLGLPSGRSWKPAQEISLSLPLIKDLGLMGPHSLWTLLDETLSEGGQKKLLQWMSSPPPSKELLRERQKTIQDLRPQTWFYTKLIIGTNSNEIHLSTLQIQEGLKNSFVTPSFYKTLIINLGVWLLSLVFLLLALTKSISVPGLLFLIFPLLSMSSLGPFSGVFHQAVGLSHHLSALATLLAAIEKRASSSPPLQKITPTLYQEKPSTSARRLDFILGFVGTQTNPLLHLFLNISMPWTMTSIFFLEKRRLQIAQSFPQVVEELSELEVFGSLLIFDRYQTQSYPEFATTPTLECVEVFHPLLERHRAVANNFAFPAGKSLGLLTGSNMSGKSTFLRTLGINQILANMGAPVFAKKYLTVPLKIETCIEVSDSLRDGYSYFYAEVRRLKAILESARTQTPVLFLIDEIFRGTNNRERQIGSKAVIRGLAREPLALGFVSTHDLELTHLAESLPSLVNLHFREDIDENGTMRFFYHLKEGPCPTTNALRIMEAEGIDVSD